MARSLPTLFGCFLLLALAGCLGHSRANGVPASAVWADHVFIQCSPGVQSKANCCSVYKDDTGEILADGLFVRPSTGRAAEMKDLQYETYGAGGIFSSNAQLPTQKTALSNGPSERIVVGQLIALASKGH